MYVIYIVVKNIREMPKQNRKYVYYPIIFVRNPKMICIVNGMWIIKWQ